MELLLEKFVDGAWQAAATLTLTDPKRGIASPCTLEYLHDYAYTYLERVGESSLSTHEPVGFEMKRYPTWAPFLLDILPSGFGRELLVDREGWPQPDGPHNDARVLAHGASNPAGNTRIAQAYRWLREQLPGVSRGWELENMRRHDADFIEYAHLHGTLVAGTSTQGQAAKLWLTRHRDGLYYADTLVRDEDAAAHYLVKMPRNNRDAVMLRHEHLWLTLARGAGLVVEGEPFMFGDLLFIPRFDRVVDDRGVHRRAMESAYSLRNVAKHGAVLFHEDIIDDWIAYADTSTLGNDLLEYLQRDMLGYCLRVDDNHGRNTAFFLTEEGIRLTPLFDFAPMFLGDDPPTRSTLWREFPPGFHNRWPVLFERWLPERLGIDNAAQLRAALAAWRSPLERTRDAFITASRDPRTDMCIPRFATVLGALDALR
ncbi:MULTISPECIES: HipA domain-containing protein [unclassified Burkholderia]|uniref:HipA domain-containing protein n=1 Tax=unclassified Burkholderia TaxID=2613784 RepID=UPI001420E088|nr:MULTISPECIES: HipA domain-containing protein [unclassified Burkholderia]NIE86014.1 HipA domain-containing protein [Burkholderia sp. Tr-860]NIF64453.1 HipA domain-containing protein [Burkholderia sp. Cy-647]NIF72975.1 HipA domain-containing protein [Burkholderia sp. Ap-962]NIF93386.1 HipA domain-containing protein [Burkholderia sp. Cy-637]NIG00542.1 HipA domain-containing protein [Burkholderia sp. Ax-1720]